MINELMEYAIARIRGYKDEKNKERFYSQYSEQPHNPDEGLIEIKAPRKYKWKTRLERRLETAVKEFYSKQGFHLREINKENEARKLHFEREINSLEEYLISIERQGIFYYIHISRKTKWE
mgnify:CR=1 FL=1